MKSKRGRIKSSPTAPEKSNTPFSNPRVSGISSRAHTACGILRHSAHTHRRIANYIFEPSENSLLFFVAGFSPRANISAPCALKASFQIYGWDMRTRILLRKTSSSHSTALTKKRTTRKERFSFLVEVAGLELAASSTRNWRATNCATPRNYSVLY